MGFKIDQLIKVGNMNIQHKNGVPAIILTFNRASYLYTTLLLLLNQKTKTVSRVLETRKVAMLAMKSYEQNEGFSVKTADEIYFVNGGSGHSSGIGGGIAETAIGIGIMAGSMETGLAGLHH